MKTDTGIYTLSASVGCSRQVDMTQFKQGYSRARWKHSDSPVKSCVFTLGRWQELRVQHRKSTVHSDKTTEHHEAPSYEEIFINNYGLITTRVNGLCLPRRHMLNMPQ